MGARDTQVGQGSSETRPVIFVFSHIQLHDRVQQKSLLDEATSANYMGGTSRVGRGQVLLRRGSPRC